MSAFAFDGVVFVSPDFATLPFVLAAFVDLCVLALRARGTTDFFAVLVSELELATAVPPPALHPWAETISAPLRVQTTDRTPSAMHSRLRFFLLPMGDTSWLDGHFDFQVGRATRINIAAAQTGPDAAHCNSTQFLTKVQVHRVYPLARSQHRRSREQRRISHPAHAHKFAAPYPSRLPVYRQVFRLCVSTSPALFQTLP